VLVVPIKYSKARTIPDFLVLPNTSSTSTEKQTPRPNLGFIPKLGKEFSFIGNQYRLECNSTSTNKVKFFIEKQ
jgi:hypothetical protein